MSSIPQLTQDVATRLQQVLGACADHAASHSGWCQRQRKLTGATFVQALVLGWVANPHATRSELAQTAATAGVPLSPQGLAQRLTQRGAACLLQVLSVATRQVLGAPRSTVPLLNRFAGVFVSDSSVLELPPALAVVLAPLWPGCGKTPLERAALKLQVRLELSHGQLEGPLLVGARMHDAKAAQGHSALTAGSLHLADLGYFSLAVFAALQQAGAYYLSRVKANTLFLALDAAPGTAGRLLTAWLEEAVAQGREQAGSVELALLMGAGVQLPCRVLARRVPPEVAAQRRTQLIQEARRKQQAVSAERLALVGWTVLVTNVPPGLLSVSEALVLYRARWQIERLFRLWKEVLEIDTWRSQQPFALLCEVYAKLLGCVLTHWLVVLGTWRDPARSWHKAVQVVQKHACHLLCCLGYDKQLYAALNTVVRAMSCACRLNKRKRAPATFQLLLDCTLGALS